MSREFSVLVIDDDPEMRVFLREAFLAEGHSVKTLASGGEVLDLLRKRRLVGPAFAWDLIVCDLKLPDTDGRALIGELRGIGVDQPVIVVTAHADVASAADALERGAFDYITKPVNPVELAVVSRRAVTLHRLERDYRELKRRLDAASPPRGLLGDSPGMKRVFDLIRRVARSNASVLVTGESGTGKEVVARSIHEASSRSARPFVAINCAAIPENLLESELFGHTRGAFTGASGDRQGLFEEAQGGTVFLDEIGDMPVALQAKLLRVLQERRVRPVGSNESRAIDVRIIAATHRDLNAAVRQGAFREDLYYRLCVVPVQIPPLRERREDIPRLAEHFLAKASRAAGLPPRRLTQAALAKLMRMSWAGNVRELENVIERAVVLAERQVIDEHEIQVERPAEQDAAVRGLFTQLPTLDRLEREYVAYVLAQTDGHKERASEILGIDRKTLYRKERGLGRQAEPDVSRPAPDPAAS